VIIPHFSGRAEINARATPFRAARAGLLVLVLAPTAPLGYSQEDCYRGQVHSEPQTVSGFLVRFQPGSASGAPGCRVEILSLQGGMIFHADDAALKLIQPGPADVNGDGAPDEVFEGYSGGAHCCWTYWIVSLGARAGPLATLKNQSPVTFVGGQEGKTDIQTSDGSFDYFDCLSHAESPLPAVFLRLEGRAFKDVGSEHGPYYEKQVQEARHSVSSAELNQFRAVKNRDEMCSDEPRAAMPLVLTIVLAYLYGAQPQQAWKALDEIWPPFDRARIRAEILKARAKGVLSYTRGVPPKARKRR